MPNSGLFAAIDLGASSARLFAGRMEGDRLQVREVTRMKNGPVQLPDGIHWDLLGIYRQMLESLGKLSREADDGELSVGIDSWGVDYGLLDADGRLLGPPFHYRDDRTDGRLEQLDRLIGLGEVYQATGIQDMAINTICQLLAERESAGFGAASRLLMVPDLFAYMLSGQARLERTIASTTQLVDARTGQLVDWLLARLGVRRDLFAPPIEPGEQYGPVLPAVAASVGMARPAIVAAVGCHDTASAVLAAPLENEGTAWVSSGTWSLVGLELDAPVISPASRQANFSNELGFGRSVRFLKNVMGHWMVQECERCWALEGNDVRLVDLLAQAEACPPFRSLVDTEDPVFAVPGDMPARIRQACDRGGEPVPETEAELVRCILDSMALAICAVLEQAEACAGKRIRGLHVVGGGSANYLLLSLLASASGLPVAAGPTEASAIGNLLAQLHARGLVGDQAEMRRIVARSFPAMHVTPHPELARAAQKAKARLAGLARAR